jgi:hypothetical protein
VRIGRRELAAQPPRPFVLWGSGDGSVKGFCARRQFSNVITYSVIYRTKEGQHRWFKFGHHGVWTPTQARERVRQIRFAADNGNDPAAEKLALTVHNSRRDVPGLWAEIVVCWLAGSVSTCFKSMIMATPSGNASNFQNPFDKTTEQTQTYYV